MEFIAHRINTITELKELPEEFGAELDLRDDLSGRIYIQHYPFEDGEDFEKYLKEYHHGTMILNVKSERIEYRILELLKTYSIRRYFFLDCSFPMIRELCGMGERRIAVRVSEYEGMDTARNMAGCAEWVWIDCFSKIPVSHKDYLELKQMGYKLCFVSPELQGQPEKLSIYKEQLAKEGIMMDAVCTKSYHIADWKRTLK